MLVFSRIAHDLAGIVMEHIFTGGELHRFFKSILEMSLYRMACLKKFCFHFQSFLNTYNFLLSSEQITQNKLRAIS